MTKDNLVLISNIFGNCEILKDDMDKILEHTREISLTNGEIIYKDESACYGFVIVKSGSLRAFTLFGEQNPKEMSIFFLQSGEGCVLCCSCINNTLGLELNLEATCETTLLVIPPIVFKELKNNYPPVANMVLLLLSLRFAQGLSAMQKALFVPLHQRIAAHLVQNSTDNKVTISHQEIADHLGSSREVISKVLKQMEQDGRLALGRGEITIM